MSRRKIGQRPAFLAPDNSYDLLVPIDYHVDGAPRQLTRVQLRRLTGADLLILDESIGMTEKLLRVTERMTGELRIVLDRLDSVDLDRIDEVMGYFRDPGSVTGATS